VRIHQGLNLQTVSRTGTISHWCGSCVGPALSYTNRKKLTSKSKNVKWQQLGKIIPLSILYLDIHDITSTYNKYTISSVPSVNEELVDFEVKFRHIIILFQSRLTRICVGKIPLNGCESIKYLTLNLSLDMWAVSELYRDCITLFLECYGFLLMIGGAALIFSVNYFFPRVETTFISSMRNILEWYPRY
jgi:hypothetical protein